MAYKESLDKVKLFVDFYGCVCYSFPRKNPFVLGNAFQRFSVVIARHLGWRNRGNAPGEQGVQNM